MVGRDLLSDFEVFIELEFWEFKTLGCFRLIDNDYVFFMDYILIRDELDYKRDFYLR